jgi:gas vesicle protein
MGEHDDMPYIVIERRSGGVTPFLWGALLGAGVALLLAPRSGAETQAEIRERAQRLRTAAEDRVNGVRDAVSDSVTRTRDRIQDRIDSVRDSIESRAEQARNAVDAGRRAARDARSELERRVAEARGGYRSAPEPEIEDEEPPVPPAPDVVITDVVIEDEDLPDLG